MDFLDERNKYLEMNDEQLGSTCGLQAFKASGHGGQKVNKTSSAVRLVHKPTKIEVTSSQSRSQHENRHYALKKLRMRIALEIRADEKTAVDNFDISMTNPGYPLFAALILDELHRNGFRIAESAQSLGLSTGRLVRLLSRDPDIWRKVNTERKTRDLKPLVKN